MVHESSQNSTHFRPYGPRTILWLLSSALRENAFYRELNYTHCDKGHEVGGNGSSDQGATLQRSMQIKVTSKTLYTPCCCQPKRTTFISFPSFNIYKLPPAKNLSSNHYMIYPSHPCQTMTKTIRKGGKVETNQPKTIMKETERERDDCKDLLQPP